MFDIQVVNEAGSLILFKKKSILVEVLSILKYLSLNLEKDQF